MRNNRVDVVYDYLQKKGKLRFTLMYEEIAKFDDRFINNNNNRKDSRAKNMAEVYADMIVDGRFIFFRTIEGRSEIHECDVREHYTYEEIKESISKFGDIILDETDEEPEVDDGLTEEINKAHLESEDTRVVEVDEAEVDDAPFRDNEDREDD